MSPLAELDERECNDCHQSYTPTGRRQQRCPACRDRHDEAERLLKKNSPPVKAPKPLASTEATVVPTEATVVPTEATVVPTEARVVPPRTLETRPTLVSLADRMLRDSGAEGLSLRWNNVTIEIVRN